VKQAVRSLDTTAAAGVAAVALRAASAGGVRDLVRRGPA
jgi:hypothetical protein